MGYEHDIEQAIIMLESILEYVISSGGVVSQYNQMEFISQVETAKTSLEDALSTMREDY